MPYTNQNASERQVVFDSHHHFQIQNRKPTSSFRVSIQLYVYLHRKLSLMLKRRFNLNLMSVMDEVVIKGQVNLWLWRIADESPRGHEKEKEMTQVEESLGTDVLPESRAPQDGRI